MCHRSPSAAGVVGARALDGQSRRGRPCWKPARWGARYSGCSLFAADGLWSHYYVFCWSDTPQWWTWLLAPTLAPGTAQVAPSFASPVMAGIQALINQKAGGPQGNPASHVLSARRCRVWFDAAIALATRIMVGQSPATAFFYDVTSGDMDVDCIGPNCYLADGSVGGGFQRPIPRSPPLMARESAGTSPPASGASTPPTWSTTGHVNPNRRC